MDHLRRRGALGRHTTQTGCGPSQKASVAPGWGVVSVSRLISQVTYNFNTPHLQIQCFVETNIGNFGGRDGTSRNWATAHLLTFTVSFGTVLVPAAVAFSLLMRYSGGILRLKV